MQNTTKATAALVTDAGSRKDRANMRGAKTKAFLTHCLGRRRSIKPPACVAIDGVIVLARLILIPRQHGYGSLMKWATNGAIVAAVAPARMPA